MRAEETHEHGNIHDGSNHRRTAPDEPARAAADAAARPALSGRLHRPLERRLREAADARRPRLERSGVRARRVAVLHRLSDLRDSEQRDAAQVRRTALDRADHADVGHRHDPARVHEERDDVLCAALPARRIGGGAVSRRHLLPDAVVSSPPARAHARLLHAGEQHRQHGGRADLRLSARQGRPLRPARLAARVHRDRRAFRAADGGRAVVAAGVAAEGEVPLRSPRRSGWPIRSKPSAHRPASRKAAART